MSDIKIERKDHLLIIEDIAINTYYTPVVSVVIVDVESSREPTPYLEVQTTQSIFTVSLTEENKYSVFNELLEYIQ